MNLLRIFCVCFFLMNALATGAQVLDKEIAVLLSENDEAKIEKAGSFIDQGNEILFANFTYPKDSLFQRSPNYIQLSENLLVGKRISRLLFETKGYYKIGFEGLIEVLKTYIGNHLDKEPGTLYPKVKSLNDSIEGYMESAKTLRGKSKLTANLKKGGKQIHQSNIKYQKAVVLCEEAIGVIERDKVLSKNEMPRDEAVTDVAVAEPKKVAEVPKTDSPQTGTDSIVETKSASIKEIAEQEAPIKEPLLQEQVVVKSAETEATKVEVYYTVQILADKNMVSETRLKTIYNGIHPIIQNRGDGWYRYSFGKFTNLSDAKKSLAQSETKGYIVAYKNEQRISLGEAKVLLVQQAK